MIGLYIFLALVIAWIWVDYFRMIDIFDREHLLHVIGIFSLGASSVLLVLIINWYWLDYTPFAMNGNFFNDFLYCVVYIGAVEEFSKIVPFLLVFMLFRSHFSEPLDYLIFICISALGFSAAENVLYFKNHGAEVVNGRAILSTVGHMFDTSLVAYGVIRYQHNRTTLNFFGIIGFFLLAALSHGFYDYWLIQQHFTGGFLITILFFLFTISWFATILNNAINNSPHFDYKKVIDPDKVGYRLLLYYGIVYVLAFVVLSIEKSPKHAATNLFQSIYISGVIAAISCIRLSRFTLLKGHWFPIRVEIPFSFRGGEYSGLTSTRRMGLRVKGENYNDSMISQYFNEEFLLYPLSKRSTYLQVPRKAYLKDKLLSKRGELIYPVKVYFDGLNGYEDMLLISKSTGTTEVSDRYPIVALMHVRQNGEKPSSKTASFKEWAYLVPIPNTQTGDFHMN